MLDLKSFNQVYCILSAEAGQRFDSCWSQCQVCRDYQAGKAKPRYPVPATQNTSLWSMFVQAYGALRWKARMKHKHGPLYLWRRGYE